MSGSWIRLLRAGMGIVSLAFVATASHAQKPKEPWDYLNEPAFNAVILYSPEKKFVYGTIYEKGKTTLIGDPPRRSRPNSASCGRRSGAAAELHAEVIG